MTEYVIFTSADGETWEIPEGSECAGASADSAIRTYLENLDGDAPKQIAAVPARSFKPRGVAVSTVKKVTLA